MKRTLKNNTRNPWIGIIASCVTALVLNDQATLLVAQNIHQTLPTNQNPNETKELPAPSQPVGPAGVDANQRVLERLKGLVIYGSVEQFNSQQKLSISENSVVLIGDELIHDQLFKVKLSAYLGQPVTVGDLDKITSTIAGYYVSKGRPVVSPVVPEQDVSDGVLRVVILQGKIGQIRIESDRVSELDKTKLQKQLRLEPNSIITTDNVLNELDWFSRTNPFRRMDVAFEKGSGIGQTDLVFKAEQSKFPVRVYAGYDNTGTESTGTDRMIAGFNWANAFGIADQQFGYQFTSSTDVSRYSAHGITWQTPILPAKHILNLYGTWSQSKPSSDDPNVNSTGNNWQIGARYTIPLPRDQGVKHGINFGTDFKHSDNNLEFGGENVYDRALETLTFNVSYDRHFSDQTGGSDFEIKLTVSPGNITSGNDDEAFANDRPGADPLYAFLKADYSKSFNLPHEMELSIRTSGQVSTGELISSEQFGLGGTDTVRGYPEQALRGDMGLFTQIELRSPEMHPLKAFGKSDWNDSLQALLFVDGGAVFDQNATDSFPSSAYAVSAGPGIRYRVGPYLSVNYDYGFRIEVDHIDDGDSGRHHFSVMASFAW